ncbi:HAD family phosphatase [Trueperella pyogenes]|uniref:HAD family hydrolase n=1 Tax=Trueperella pyogenes TaxID=1661 RepID=UPI000E0DE028|nr:HAD family phosphatase [Trueperella pyogenes]
MKIVPAVPNVRVVLFDVGGVVINHDPDFVRVAQILKMESDILSLKRIRQAFWKYRDAYDLGISDADFWGLVTEELNIGKPDSQRLAALVYLDSEGINCISDEMSNLMEVIADRGYRMGILSNAPYCVADTVKAAPWTRNFEILLFSAQIGVAKPAHEAFRHAVDAFGVNPSEILFFDDRLRNIHAAQKAGMQAHRWLGIETAKDVLGIGE